MTLDRKKNQKGLKMQIAKCRTHLYIIFNTDGLEMIKQFLSINGFDLKIKWVKKCNKSYLCDFESKQIFKHVLLDQDTAAFKVLLFVLFVKFSIF